MSAADDTRDINAWLDIILAKPDDITAITARLALSNLAALAIRRALEVEELKARLEGRPSAAVLRLVNGGVP